MALKYHPAPDEEPRPSVDLRPRRPRLRAAGIALLIILILAPLALPAARPPGAWLVLLLGGIAIGVICTFIFLGIRRHVRTATKARDAKLRPRCRLCGDFADRPDAPPGAKIPRCPECGLPAPKL